MEAAALLLTKLALEKAPHRNTPHPRGTVLCARVVWGKQRAGPARMH